MLKVYIDGQEGTTGLQIHERLATRDDITVLKIDAEKRKDTVERKRLINQADLVILCLPDAASKEAVTLLDNATTRVIDASTAFRTHQDWAYGLPEIRKGQREHIRSSRFVANPGCHASALLTAIVPLIDNGIMPVDYPLSCTSVTGYSGGGRKLIERYEVGSESRLEAPRHYGLDLQHKHLPEIMHVAGLHAAPIFMPIVANFYKGMAATVPLHNRLLTKSADAAQIHAVLAAHYAGEPFVRVMPFGELPADGFFRIMEENDTNLNDIFVLGDAERTLIISRLDNLGKGASGAAVQNMNIMFGLEETRGLLAGP